LFTFGYDGPQHPRRVPSLATLSNPDFLKTLRQIGGTPDEILENVEVMELMAPVLRADFGLCESYRYQPSQRLPCPISAYGGSDDEYVSWPGLTGWGEETSKSARVRLFPGGHFVPQTNPDSLLRQLIMDLDSDHVESVAGNAPTGNDVHIWGVRLDQPPGVVTELLQTLSDDERNRADRFTREPDRIGSIVSRAAVRAILSRDVGIPPGEVQFGYGRFGKPFLLEPRATDLEFNLSHSGLFALVAVARGRPIGVDVELIRTDFDVTGVARMAFAKAEWDALSAQPPSKRAFAFYDLWTRKEAILKCRGTGLGQLDDAIAGAGPSHPTPAVLGEETGKMTVAKISPAGEYAGAVAAEGELSSLTCTYWSPNDFGT
jgi:4'-phosphopantetheinyl transferase